MRKTLAGALESTLYSYRFIDFTPEQKMLLEDAARAVDETFADRFLKDAAALRAEQEASNPMEDPEHPAHSLCEAQSRLYPVLVLLAGVKALEADYLRDGISMQVLRDTLSDIPLWMNNCEAHFGYQGLREFRWLTNHMRGVLYRLGRLEYIYTPSRVPAHIYRGKTDGALYVFLDEEFYIDACGELSADGIQVTFSDNGKTVRGHLVDPLGAVAASACEMNRTDLEELLRPGDPVLDVHIPEGPPMLPKEIGQSLESAPAFFEKHRSVTGAKAFTCGSWLMNPGLSKIVPGSNIAAFGERFYRVPYTLRDDQVFERVFGEECEDYKQIVPSTRLQKGVLEWYRQGGKLRQMQGVILFE